MATNNNKQATLSPREMEVLAIAWQCMEQQPKIDMQKLASLTGYTPGSASVTLGNIKRKLKLLAPSASSSPASASPAGTPKKARTKASRANMAAGEKATKRGSADAGFEKTTAGKRRKKNSGGDDDDDDGVNDHDDDDEFMGRFEEETGEVKVKVEEGDQGLLQGLDGYAGMTGGDGE